MFRAGKVKKNPWYLLNSGSAFPPAHRMDPGRRPSSRWKRMKRRILFLAASRFRSAYISPPMGCVSSQILL